MSEVTFFTIGYTLAVVVHIFQRERVRHKLLRKYAIWAWGKDCTDVMAAVERFEKETK